MPKSPVLTSAILAHVPHAFSTRLGGVSTGHFASLNFGNPSDLAADQRDPAANIHTNWRLLVESLPGGPALSARERIEVHQVHGAAVHAVARGEPAHTTASDTRADAIVTDDPRRLLAIRTADCAPVLIASRDGAVVAAVHAGWRGVVAGAASAAVEAMRRLDGLRAGAGLVAAIGPCIGVEHFEVGAEVAAEFRRVFGPATAHIVPGEAAGKFFVDLKGALAEQLRAAGVEEVDALPHCTYAQPELFYSHRRATHERTPTGRMAAVIGCAG